MDNAKFVTLDGVKTRYFEAGKGDDLVLIHGGKFGTFYSAYHWSLNFHELSKHFHVYAFDKLGMGDTDNPKSDADYTMAAVIEHARAFVRISESRMQYWQATPGEHFRRLESRSITRNWLKP